MMINLPHAAEIPAINGIDLSDSSIALLADMVFDEIIASPQFPSLSHSREALIRQASILLDDPTANLFSGINHPIFHLSSQAAPMVSPLVPLLSWPYVSRKRSQGLHGLIAQ